MKRWHEDAARCRNRQKFEQGLFGFSKELGRYRKRKPCDCGKAKCQICHSDKFPERTLHEHEIVSDISFREQINEL